MALDTSVIIRLRDKFTDRMRQMKKGVRQFRDDMSKIRGTFELAGNMNLAAENMEKLSRQARGLVEAPIKSAANFEQQIAVLGNVSGASGEQLEKLKERARELGEQTRFSAPEAAEGMINLARAGQSVDEMLGTIGPSLNLATSAQLDLGSTADIATNIMSGFGLEAEHSARTMDVLTKAANSANTNVQGLGNTMKFAAPFAAQAGASMEETAAAAGKLADSGIKGSQAGTALRAMFQRLQAPSKAGQQAIEELELQVTDSEDNMRQFSDVLADMSTALDDVSSSQRQRLLKQLFETEASGAASILIDAAGGGELQELTQTLRESEGAAQDAADAVKNTTAGELAAFESKMEDLKITIGNELLPVLNDLLDDIKPTIEAIGDWVEENPELARTIGSSIIKIAALTAVLGPLLRVTAALTTTVGGLRAAIAGAKGLNVALSSTTGAATSLSKRLGQGGLVAAAAAASVAIGTLIRSLMESADKATREIGADTTLENIREFFGQEDRGLANRAAEKLEQQGVSDARINELIRGGRVKDGQFISSEGDVLATDQNEQQAMQAARVQQQRRADVSLIRRLAGTGINKAAIEGRMGDVRSGLQSRFEGMSDDQVDRIVRAIEQTDPQKLVPAIRSSAASTPIDLYAGPSGVGAP